MTSYIGKNCTIKIDGKPLRRKLAPPRMTVRERIADWISGGMYGYWMRHAEYKDEWRAACYQSDRYRRKLQARLDRIAAQETPKANATVKRMARIARGEE